MHLVLILIASALAAFSGVPGLLTGRRSSRGERISAALLGAASLLGLAGAATAFGPMPPGMLNVSLPLAAAGAGFGVDPLSAFFLFPVFLMGGLGSVYGLGYWPQSKHPAEGRQLRLFWGLMVAGMSLLVVARHALIFLFGWETMALSAFMLVGTEQRREEARRASWIFLVATHAGTLLLIVAFALLRRAAGSFELRPIGIHEAGLGLLTAVFFFALAGFGLKAGLMPLHFWLPSAHATAPSHVSALMSGVLIKMGIYGLVRITSLLPEPPLAWGAILLFLGGVSGVLGVAFAIAQHDLKRLLAYHSIENIGIIAIGLGVAMIGRSLNRPDWVVLGLAGSLLHVWNHCLFKSLLFFSAGSVVHASHTREIDRLGGLAKMMPWTAGMFLIGAAAICGLPPLNGFISEWLIYTGLFGGAGIGGGHPWIGMALSVPVLAMIGALALACFAKAYGAVFLGSPRTRASVDVHEAPRIMIGPMLVLASCCALIGLLPIVAVPALDRAIAAWGLPVDPRPRLASAAPLAAIGMVCLIFTAILVPVLAFFIHRLRGAGANRQVTWDCGYAEPTARMQYTSSSFAQMLTDLFRSILRPHVRRPGLVGIFPPATRFASHIGDVVLDGCLLPAARVAERWLGRVRGFQHGMAQRYVLEILVAVVLLLAWTLPIHDLFAGFFAR